MDNLVEIIFLKKDKFYFKKLNWIEETSLDISPSLPKVKAYLAKALVKVNDNLITQDDAIKLVKTIPYAIAERFFIIYNSKMPKRKFYTIKEPLYVAPPINKMRLRIQEEEDLAEEQHDRMTEMDETDAAIFNNSGLKGVSKPTEDTL